MQMPRPLEACGRWFARPGVRFAVVALALGINPVLDMFETCCNVAGDNVCTYIVAKRGGLMRQGGGSAPRSSP